MRRHSLITAVLAVPILLTGCMRHSTTTAIRHADFSSVAVRFALPGEGPQYSMADSPSNAQLVVDRGYRGFQEGGFGGSNPTVPTQLRHVALWGNGFDGTDITQNVTLMKPGAYMFAFIDPAYSTMIQGWVDVNYSDHDMLDILQKWLNSIPKQKQQLAFNFDAQGRMDGNSPGTFQNFANELGAFDRLEERINRAINAELAARGRRHVAVAQFLKRTELLLLPGEDETFRKTTRAAFTEDDLAGVRSGDALTKIILVADYQDTQWKLNHVNRLYNDLTRAKVVLKGVVDRLERRRGMFLLTDHLHDHDAEFLSNERQLQYAIGEIERMDVHMAGLRERRMALAFISELVAPESNFFALDREHADLIRERRVVEAEMKQLDVTLTGLREDNPKRVAVERNRQNASAGMAAIDSQLIDLEQARTALEMMIDTTDILHRQGDKRLLTSTFVGQQLPFRVREAIEHEALMTVRLEGSDKVFVPGPVGVPSVVAASSTPARNRSIVVGPSRSVHVTTEPAKSNTPRRMVTSGTARPNTTSSDRGGPTGQDAHKNVKPTTTRWTRPSPPKTKTPTKSSSTWKPKPVTGTRTTQATPPKSVVQPVRRQAPKTDTKMVTPGKRVATAKKPTAPAPNRWDGFKRRPASSTNNKSKPAPKTTTTTKRKMVTPGKRVATAKKPTTPAPNRRDGFKRRPASSTKSKTKPAPKTTTTTKRKMVTPGKRVTTAKKPTTPAPNRWDRSKTRTASSTKSKTKPAPKTTTTTKRNTGTPGKRVASVTKPSPPANGLRGQNKWKRFGPPAPTESKNNGRSATTVSRRGNKSGRNQGNNDAESIACELPLFVKLLVPPCWFASDLYNNNPRSTAKVPNRNTRTSAATKNRSKRSTHVHSVKKQPKKPTKARTVRRRSNNADDGDSVCNLPFFVKALVPPCWFASDFKNKTSSSNGTTSRGRLAASRNNKPDKVNKAKNYPRKPKVTSRWAKKVDSPRESAQKNRSQLVGLKDNDRNVKNNRNKSGNIGNRYIVVLMTALDDYPVLVTADAAEARRFARQDEWVTQALVTHARKQAGRDHVRLSGVGIWKMVDGDPQSFELIQRFDAGDARGFDARKFSPLVFQPARFGRKRK